jgi:putative acetyltransferase
LRGECKAEHRSDVRIRTETVTDIPHIRRINEAAFGSPVEATLVDVLRERVPDVISLVADDDGEVVGHLMFSPVRVEGAQELRAMALAPMAVTPDRQRTGIGSQWSVPDLAECTRRGVEAVVVVGHPTYYPRFGFVRASTFRIACEFDVDDDAFMVVELVPGVLKGGDGYRPLSRGVQGRVTEVGRLNGLMIGHILIASAGRSRGATVGA